MFNNDTCPIKTPGFWNNGDCSLLCRKAEWYDLVIFFFGNYLAHVATVTTRPGEPLLLQALYLSSALFFPLTGLSLGWAAIRSKAIFASSPLQTAARAGALCTVVPIDRHDMEEGGQLLRQLIVNGHTANGEEGPSESVDVAGEDIADTSTLIPSVSRSPSGLSPDEESTKRPWTHAQFHGDCSLPTGYTLVLVPWDAEFDGDTKSTERWWNKPFKGFRRSKDPPTEVASSSSYIKVVVSMAQIIFGVVTIYRTRGNQIERYGYAAFGLSVTPYVWMSLINLLGNIIRPSYPALYVTNSKWLEEATRLHASAFKPGLSTIGRLSDSSADKAHDKFAKNAKLERTWKMPRSRIGQRLMALDEQMLSVVRHPADVYDSVARRYNNINQGPWIEGIVRIAIGLSVPLVVVGALSGFESGESTVMQRFWMVSWIACGSFMRFAWKLPRISYSAAAILRFVNYFLVGLIPTIPAIGGLSVAAQMMKEHGVCQSPRPELRNVMSVK
jgi:hypothetical protein